MGEVMTLRFTSPQAPSVASRRYSRFVDVVVLDPLTRGDAQRPVRVILRSRVESQPLPGRQLASGGALDAHHEEVVVGLAAALAARLLLVDAEELGELLGLARDGGLFAPGEAIELLGERVSLPPASGDEEEALARQLDALVLRHDAGIGALEGDGSLGALVAGHLPPCRVRPPKGGGREKHTSGEAY
jgi:hypothetical protein